MDFCKYIDDDNRKLGYLYILLTCQCKIIKLRNMNKADTIAIFHTIVKVN